MKDAFVIRAMLEYGPKKNLSAFNAIFAFCCQQSPFSRSAVSGIDVTLAGV